MHEPDFEYTGAGDEQMKVLGKSEHTVKIDAAGKSKTVEFVVTKHPLNPLGITALRQLQVNVDPLIHVTSDGTVKTNQKIMAITTQKEEAEALQKACQELCKELLDLFKPELGCLKDYELEVMFKPDTKPIYCKPRTVPLTLLDNFNQAYEAGIKKGKWIPTQFK